MRERDPTAEGSPQERALVVEARGRVGKVLKRKWRLDELLGVGGMGAVYAATHERNRTEVAVKILHPSLSLHAPTLERFQREGLIANAVRHPGTVKVIDDDVSEDGLHFLVMERLVGETLEALWLRNDGQLPTRTVLGMVDTILDVLVAAHANGILHRDIKPVNVFLTTKGTLRLLDFGLARISEVNRMTRTGMQLGTAGFMSPEQVLGRSDEIDGRTDIWAVGATLFFLFARRFVHEAPTPAELNVLVATVPVPSLADVLPGASPPLVHLVDKALAFKKEDRWESAAEMRKALRGVLRQLEANAKLPTPSPAQPKPTRAALPRLFASSGFSEVIDRQVEVDKVFAAAAPQADAPAPAEPPAPASPPATAQAPTPAAVPAAPARSPGRAPDSDADEETWLIKPKELGSLDVEALKAQARAARAAPVPAPVPSPRQAPPRLADPPEAPAADPPAPNKPRLPRIGASHEEDEATHLIERGSPLARRYGAPDVESSSSERDLMLSYRQALGEEPASELPGQPSAEPPQRASAPQNERVSGPQNERPSAPQSDRPAPPQDEPLQSGDSDGDNDLTIRHDTRQMLAQDKDAKGPPAKDTKGRGHTIRLEVAPPIAEARAKTVGRTVRLSTPPPVPAPALSELPGASNPSPPAVPPVPAPAASAVPKTPPPSPELAVSKPDAASRRLPLLVGAVAVLLLLVLVLVRIAG